MLPGYGEPELATHRSAVQPKRLNASMLILTSVATLASAACAREPDQHALIKASSSIKHVESKHRQNPAPSVPGQLLVRFKSRITPERAEAILAEHHARILTRYADQRLFHIELPAGMTIPVGLASFLALEEVEFAEPNQLNTIED